MTFDTGELTWLNAGHPLPLLVRDGTYVGELACAPSLPMGLGGPVREVATERLQRGDRVLFYTDGVTEMRSPEGEQFGRDRLADFLVRATLDRVSPAETVRRLSASIVAYNEDGPDRRRHARAPRVPRARLTGRERARSGWAASRRRG